MTTPEQRTRVTVVTRDEDLMRTLARPGTHDLFGLKFDRDEFVYIEGEATIQLSAPMTRPNDDN